MTIEDMGYTREYIKIREDAYQLGRRDAEIEHDNMCETCVHKVTKSDIEQIRLDVIEECIQLIKDNWFIWNVGIIKAVIDKLEELKG